MKKIFLAVVAVCAFVSADISVASDRYEKEAKLTKIIHSSDCNLGLLSDFIDENPNLNYQWHFNSLLSLYGSNIAPESEEFKTRLSVIELLIIKNVVDVNKRSHAGSRVEKIGLFNPVIYAQHFPLIRFLETCSGDLDDKSVKIVDLLLENGAKTKIGNFTTGEKIVKSLVSWRKTPNHRYCAIKTAESAFNKITNKLKSATLQLEKDKAMKSLDVMQLILYKIKIADKKQQV